MQISHVFNETLPQRDVMAKKLGEIIDLTPSVEEEYIAQIEPITITDVFSMEEDVQELKMQIRDFETDAKTTEDAFYLLAGLEEKASSVMLSEELDIAVMADLKNEYTVACESIGFKSIAIDMDKIENENFGLEAAKELAEKVKIWAENMIKMVMKAIESISSKIEQLYTRLLVFLSNDEKKAKALLDEFDAFLKKNNITETDLVKGEYIFTEETYNYLEKELGVILQFATFKSLVFGLDAEFSAYTFGKAGTFMSMNFTGHKLKDKDLALLGIKKDVSKMYYLASFSQDTIGVMITDSEGEFSFEKHKFTGTPFTKDKIIEEINSGVYAKDMRNNLSFVVTNSKAIKTSYGSFSKNIAVIKKEIDMTKSAIKTKAMEQSVLKESLTSLQQTSMTMAKVYNANTMTRLMFNKVLIKLLSYRSYAVEGIKSNKEEK